MMKVRYLIVLSSLLFSAISWADELVDSQRKQLVMAETETFDTVIDVPLRVGGFIATVVGTGLFIGSSPVTGLMTALHPHKAIHQALDFLVMRPARYTFVRPVNNVAYDIRPYREQ